MPIALIDIIANQLEENGNDISVTRLSDDSGSGIEVKQRKDKTEYITFLEFTGDGTEMTGISLYSGDIVETIEHSKII